MAGNKNSGGHNRKGAQFHVIAGTFRADRHTNADQPDPPKGIPKPPKSLSGEAKAEWQRMIARLTESRTLSIVDDAALFQYAKLFAETEGVEKDANDARKLSRDLKELAAEKLDGDALVNAIGKIVELQKIISATTTKLRQQRMALRQYLVEFGMTPSSRGRVKVPKDAKAPGSNKERFFGAH